MSKSLERMAGTLAMLCLSGSNIALAADTLPEIQVKAENGTEPKASETTKSYTVKSSETATRLNTSLKETPQSISVITRQLIDDFKLTSINDVLDMSTGIKVERAETDRTYYTARGSDITNFQIDGLGVPFPDGLLIGDIDTAVYDRIEVLRGATGLLSGTGNPSATINFIRKRPTADFQAKVDLTVGSWDKRRIDADLSGPLNAAGNVRARLVLSNQNRHSYLDRYSQERNVAYGIIEADITDNTTVALGHTYQQNDTNSPMWGSLPLLYSDNTRRHYSRSASTSPDWSYWNTTNNITFAELTHLFNNGWKLKTQLTRKEMTGNAKLLYVYMNEDRVTGTGLIGWPGAYRDSYKELIADVYASGPFTLGGREHELVIGSNWSRSTYDEHEKAAYYGTTDLTSFDSIGDLPQPAWIPGDFGSFDIKRLNSYAAVKFNLSDRWKLTSGANLLSYEYTGISYGEERETKAHDKVTPYLGAVFNLNDQHSLYASYTGIYNPQTKLDRTFTPLAPLQGKNYEIGIKSELLQHLNTSFSIFRNEQENLGQQAGAVGSRTIYEGIDATTKGYEFDISGEVSERLKLSGGYTRLMSVKGKDDQNVKPYTPRQLLKLTATYQVPYIEKLKVGASINWQDETHVDIDNVRVRQDSYALVNLMANYEIDQHWNAAVNVYNLTDEKYLTSLMWANGGQSYYGAPMNASATLTWKY
ncbi:TonB-dependent siderophore receptor [Methylobacillus caricis]|uniref:TonB-dependent siderophore receptor n=1 Tax=Methylobacillus caricis TaxID=1971611 RepID=UPI001CFF691E|nr:TonB-dependent siderophore receptor [Methylobacillus caricis]MCB5186484.1 TonB-dependent siderophore receptor [Methylobacillus caricis]